MNIEDLVDLGWKCLDGEVNSTEKDKFIEQCRNIFCSKEAKEQSVVYAWATAQKIPRVLGESNITNIGQTKNTIFERYCSADLYSGSNWHKCKTIVEKYGPWKMYFIVSSNPRQEESRLLSKYYEDHCELPPENNQSGAPVELQKTP
jgi:hypothetical protein